MDYEEALKQIQRARAVEGNHGAFKRVHSLAQNEFPRVSMEETTIVASNLMTALDSFDQEGALETLRRGHAMLTEEYENDEEKVEGQPATDATVQLLVEIRDQVDRIGRTAGAW